MVERCEGLPRKSERFSNCSVAGKVVSRPDTVWLVCKRLRSAFRAGLCLEAKLLMRFVILVNLAISVSAISLDCHAAARGRCEQLFSESSSRLSASLSPSSRAISIPFEPAMIPKTLVVSLVDMSADVALAKLEIVKQFYMEAPQGRTLVLAAPGTLELLKGHYKEFYDVIRSRNFEFLLNETEASYLSSSWVRDFAPILINTANGSELIAFDYIYDQNQAKKEPHYSQIQRHIARALNLPLKRIAILAEGGNFLSDPSGRVYVSKKVIERNPNFSVADLTEKLKQALHAVEIVWLPRIDSAKEMTGHVDMSIRFVDSKNVIVGKSSVDGVRQPLEEIATIMREKGFQVSRLAVKSVANPVRADLPGFLSSTNAIPLGKTILVPRYSTPLDAAARSVYSSFGLSPVFIDGSSTFLGGSLHCMSYVYGE